MNGIHVTQTRLSRRSRFTWILILGVTLPASASAGGPDEVGAPSRILTNDSVVWELTPSFDIEISVPAEAVLLVEHPNRHAVASTCLDLLHDEHRCIVAHLVLCEMFDRMDPCVSIDTQGGARIYLHTLDVRLTRSESGTMVASPTHPETQATSLNQYWENLRTLGVDRFEQTNASPVLDRRETTASTTLHDDTIVERTLLTMLAEGPAWVTSGLGNPLPFFDETKIEILRQNEALCADACLSALLSDDSFTSAHLLLCTLFATDRRRRVTVEDDAFELIIDGLTARVSAANDSPHWRVTYPEHEFEKHYLRHRWLMRLASQK